MLTRPTAQSVREALFNILTPAIAGTVFIDMYAGSGAIGIEALSRGAGKAVFIDNSRACRDIINGNLDLLRIDRRNVAVLDADLGKISAWGLVRDALSGLCGAPADIIYADPPYKYDGLDGLPQLISASGLCGGDGVFILEHSSKTVLPDGAGAFYKYRDRQYGDTRLSFYRARTGDEVEAESAC